ncbi:unnamed protein product, partial [Ilex paraguariensis]
AHSVELNWFLPPRGLCNLRMVGKYKQNPLNGLNIKPATSAHHLSGFSLVTIGCIILNPSRRYECNSWSLGLMPTAGGG